MGLILEVLDDHKYLVYLMGANGEMTVEQSELRTHQEWIGGNGLLLPWCASVLLPQNNCLVCFSK